MKIECVKNEFTIVTFNYKIKKWVRWPNTALKVSIFEVILVLIFPHSDWIQRDTSYPNAGKCGPENSEYEHFFQIVNSPGFSVVSIRKQNHITQTVTYNVLALES